MALSVAIWGRPPPPIGGVSRAIVLMQGELAGRGIDVRLFHTGQFLRSFLTAGAAAIRGRRTDMALLNLSTLRGFEALVVAGALSGRRVVAYFHGGSFPERWTHLSPARRASIRRACGRLTTAWVTNSDLRDWLLEVGADLEVEIVAPLTSAVLTPRPAAHRNSSSAAVFEFQGEELYGVEIAIEALRALRDAGEEWTLDVVLYGAPAGDLRDRRDSLASDAWLRVETNLDDRGVEALLDRSALLLRPTSSDGDSLVVRQALAAGCRVIATDVVPRPAGVELAARRADAFAAAILNGASVSDGTGLGGPVDKAIVDFLEAHRNGAVTRP